MGESCCDACAQGDWPRSAAVMLAASLIRAPSEARLRKILVDNAKYAGAMQEHTRGTLGVAPDSSLVLR